MANSPFWLNVLVCTASLAGLLCLARASERQGQALLGHMPTLRERLRWRLLGWPLLLLALTLCVQGWGAGIGVVAWLGCLCVTGTTLVFALAKKIERPRHPQKPLLSPLQSPRSRAWRVLALTLLAIGPIAFAWTLAGVPVKPVARADAIHGQVGPWPFILAEVNHDPPERVVGNIALKSFQLRFCDACDTAIRAVYLKVNQPRSLRGVGAIFNGARWDRSVDIQFPANTRADSKLWLTVQGKDGTVHQTAVLLADIAPTTVRWFTQHNGSTQGKNPHAEN